MSMTEKEQERVQRSGLFEKMLDSPEYQAFEQEVYDRLHSDLLLLGSVRSSDEAMRLAGSLGAKLEVLALAAGEASTGPRLAEEVRLRYEAAAARERDAVRRSAERARRTTTASVPTT